MAMRKIYFILIAMLIVIAFAPPDKVKAGTPGQVSLSDSRQVLDLDGNASCVPLISLEVTVTNGSSTDICEGCPTWYISVWEWDGSSGYHQIGSSQAFSSGPTYHWPVLTWDYPNYRCLVLVWHYVDTGGGGCGFTMKDSRLSQCWSSNPPSSWSEPDFYPCQ